LLAASIFFQPPALTFTLPHFRLEVLPAPTSKLQCEQLQRFHTLLLPSYLPMQLIRPLASPPLHVSIALKALPIRVLGFGWQLIKSFQPKLLTLLKQFFQVR
jgi:hypothetical protein